MLPYITKRRITTNLKTMNNQKCQKIKLHGTLTTKELKKHLSRSVGGVETGDRQPSKKDMLARWGWLNYKLNTQNFLQKLLAGVAMAGETPSLTGEFVGKWG